jgi:cytochrome c biogenesis protein CcmG, thiol:disulfide interchange protein DsbE
MSIIGWKSFVVGAVLLIAAGTAGASATVGQPAPQLRTTELNGQEFDLASELGKVVIVNFWATWCAPCRKEIPALDAFYKSYHNQGLEMIGISADSRHDRSDVQKVAQSLSYPAAMLNDSTTNGFGDPEDLPTTWVIGRDGVVHAELTPDKMEVTENSLDEVVLPLLHNKASANKASAMGQ